MRRTLAAVALIVSGVARAAGTPPPSCPIGSAWTQTWTNPDGDVTVTLTSPCHVFFDTEFVITVRATDSTCGQSGMWPGQLWAVSDTRLDTSVLTTIASPSPGFMALREEGGPSPEFLRTVAQRYTVLPPTDHRIRLSFQPRKSYWSEGVAACYGSAHFEPVEVIGTVTYDPLPGAAVLASTADSGGCGSSGIAPAALGLVALVAAGWPRRRRR